LVGIINLCKPSGMSSHDAVNCIRRLCGLRRVGHGGTLDPGACGVLPIFVGWATRLLPYIDTKKAYRTELTLGITTDTQDSGGTTLDVNDCTISPRQLADACAAFIGPVMQLPPMTSAIRIDGQRLYQLARQGKEIDRPKRQIVIYSLHIRKIWPEDTLVLGTGTRVLLDIECSAGTYIRTLCADIGQKLGCGAHMSFLVRTRAASCQLAQTHTLEELTLAANNGELSQLLLPPDSILQHLPQITIADQENLHRLTTGQAFFAECITSDSFIRVYDVDGVFLALAQPTETAGWLRPVRVFPPAFGKEEA